MQLPDEAVLAFHRSLKPMKVARVDWRNHGQLKKRVGISPPILSSLGELMDSLALAPALELTGARPGRAIRYIDPDDVADA